MREAALHRQRARDFEQRENWKRAIEAYELAMEADRKTRRDIDPALYNRVGDLYRRIGDVKKAVYHYERAAEGHLSAGFYNNAIALCNKILRNQPNRHSAYLRLGKIGAAKGFLSDARRHFLEYAERMQRSNKLDEAFAALIEFANVSSDPEIRLMVAEQLLQHKRQAAAVEELRLAWRDLRQLGREQDAEEVRDRILGLAPDRDPEVDPPEESTMATPDDVEGVVDLPEILPYDEPEPERAATEPAARERELEAPTSVVEPLIEEPEPETYETEPLDVVPTTLEDPDRLAEMASEEPPPAEGLDLEPTTLTGADAGAEELAALDEEGLEIVPTEFIGKRPPSELDEEFVPPGAEDLDIVPTAVEEPEAEAEDFEEAAGEEHLDVLPTAYGADDEAAYVEPAPESPPGELELALPATREEPLDAVIEPPASDAIEPETLVVPVDRVRDLESRLVTEGRKPETLVELADALLEDGDRDQATQYLTEAAELYEAEGRYEDARLVVEEQLQLDVNNVRAYQKRVQLALMAKDREGLIAAYLDLADCLDRTDASDKAKIVLTRVLDIDPGNRRARAVLELVRADDSVSRRVAAGAPKPAKSDEYVDLRSLIVEEEEAAAKSTRFRIPAADPKSEADVNFAEMLKQFRSMVSETIEKEDSSSHYDLGCAYRDMGLLDEAITEFQIAARSPQYRLRAIEMLGACFLEKGEHRIAVKVLARALQVPGHKDEELVEIFYAMGRAYEEIGETRLAVEWYERVMGCDVRFKDASRRAAALRQ